jgi:hypothetical protein
MSSIYIAIAIVVLLIVAMLVFSLGKNRKASRLTPLAGLAFAFILAGILFGENRLIGYVFLGVGVILAIMDIFYRSSRK